MNKLLASIEDGEICQDGLMSSSSRSLLRRFQRNPEMAEVALCVTLESSEYTDVLLRMRELIDQDVRDPAERSDADMSLCAYFYLVAHAVDFCVAENAKLVDFIRRVDAISCTVFPRFVDFVCFVATSAVSDLVGENSRDLGRDVPLEVDLPCVDSCDFYFNKNEWQRNNFHIASNSIIPLCGGVGNEIGLRVV